MKLHIFDIFGGKSPFNVNHNHSVFINGDSVLFHWVIIYPVKQVSIWSQLLHILSSDSHFDIPVLVQINMNPFAALATVISN